MYSMFLGKKIRMVLGAILILISMTQCKNANVSPSTNNKMQQVYYTQEGQPYVLKTVTKNVSPYASGNIAAYPTLYVNWDQGVDTAFPNAINITTSKKIIPLYATFSAIKISDSTVFIDIATPFYYVLLGDGSMGSYSGVKSLSKMLPYVQRSYFTDNSHFSYINNYGSVVYSLDDFLNVSSKLYVAFELSQAWALTGRNSNYIRFTAGTNYSTSVTITYFELIN